MILRSDGFYDTAISYGKFKTPLDIIYIKYQTKRRSKH